MCNKAVVIFCTYTSSGDLIRLAIVEQSPVFPSVYPPPRLRFSLFRSSSISSSLIFSHSDIAFIVFFFSILTASRTLGSF